MKRRTAAITIWYLLAAFCGAAFAESGLEFEGNSAFSAARLEREIRRYSVRTSPPMRKTDADDAAFFLAEFYRSKGFTETSVRAEWRGENNPVILRIDEGAPQWLGRISFEGNEFFTTERLSNLAVASLRQSARRLTGRLRFVESGIDEAAEKIRELYFNEGFLDARVAVETMSGPKAEARDVIFLIHEGVQSRVGDVFASGYPPDASGLRESIEKLLEAQRGAAWTPERALQLRSAVVRKLGEHGYFAGDAEIETMQSADGIVSVRVVLHPGEVFHIGEISVSGTDRTFEGAVRQRLGIAPGDVYKSESLRAAEHRLWFSGAFSEVTFQTEPTGRNEVDLEVRVVEGRARQVRGTAGYSQWEQLFLQASFTDRNFLGTLRRLSIDANYSQLGYGAQAQLSDPWLFNSETTGSIAAFYQRAQLPAFSADFAGGSLGIERLFEEPKQTGYFLRYVWRGVSNTEVYGVTPDALPEGINYSVGAVQWGQALDRRNDVLAPMGGYLLKYEFEAATDWLGGDLNYLKAGVQAAKYFPLREILPERPWVPFVLLNHRAGLLLPYGRTRSVPVPERYFLGGPNSVRSFQFDGMPPRDADGDPTGGELFWQLNAEIQAPVFGPLFVVLFCDAGNLAPSPEQYSWEETRIGPGIGARLYTPVGAVSVDYGYNLIRRDGDPIGAVQFGFGFNF